MSDGRLTSAEIEHVCDMIETVLADDQNTMRIFDVTSGGALSMLDVVEYREHLASAQFKLRTMQGSDPMTLPALTAQAVRFAAYLRGAVTDGDLEKAAAFADCLPSVAREVADASNADRNDAPAPPQEESP